MARLGRLHRIFLPVVTPIFLGWITIGRLFVPAPGQARAPWLKEWAIFPAAVFLAVPLAVVGVQIIDRPSVRATGSVNPSEALGLSLLYLSMAAFAATVHSVDDSVDWPSIATRVLGSSFGAASDRIETWSPVAILVVTVVLYVVTSVASRREDRRLG